MKPIVPFLIFLYLLFSCNSGDSTKKIAQDSLKVLQDSLKRNPDNPLIWFDLYQMQLTKTDTAGALNSINRYLELVPEDEKAGLEFAWLLAYKKDSSALHVTDWLMKSKDQQIAVKAQYIQSHYYGNIGETVKALQLLEKVIEANYQFTDAHIQKGIILFEQSKHTEALTSFTNALKIEPSNAEVYYWIGESHRALGNRIEAEDWQKKYEALK